MSVLHWPGQWSASTGPGGARIDIIDDTFVAAPPTVLAPLLHHPANQLTWWPHLRLELIRERGVKGAEWVVQGQIEGTMEIWLEPFWEGAVVHHYVRGLTTPGAPPDEGRRHVRRWKQAVTRLKDLLEPGAGPNASGAAQ
ncbi:MAG TPA: hypothetical protein VES01_01830 [Dermatophilaceae bacterium]|nr:hypothetical protein [Dermatophilaceae bacterium]